MGVGIMQRTRKRVLIIGAGIMRPIEKLVANVLGCGPRLIEAKSLRIDASALLMTMIFVCGCLLAAGFGAL